MSNGLEELVFMGQVAELPMAKDDTEQDHYKAVKLERILADRGAIVAKNRGQTLAQYLSAMVRSQINRDFSEVLKAMQSSMDRDAKKKTKD